jgi:hypothetical protein
VPAQVPTDDESELVLCDWQSRQAIVAVMAPNKPDIRSVRRRQGLTARYLGIAAHHAGGRSEGKRSLQPGIGIVVLPGCPPDVADKRLGRRRCRVGFLSHLRSLRATMSQKSSVPQAISFVSQVLKRDILFVNSDELALKMLEQAKPDKEFHDYTLPFLHSKIMYFFGEPVDSYKPLLDQMIITANSTLSLIEKVKSRCPALGCDSATNENFRALQSRAQRSKRVAMNSIAYGIAQDLASRITSAEALEPLAQEYADELVKAVKKREGIDDDNEKDETNDTIAFVSLVVEGRKPSRNMAKIKNVVATLKLIIAHQEQSMKDSQKSTKDPHNPDHIVSKSRRTILNTARAHLSSAQELLEE